MKITQKQIEAKQAQTPNGWAYDWKKAAIWGDHTAIKRLDIGGGDYITARLEYMDEYEKITNEHGCSCNRPTGRNVPNISLQLWHQTPGEAFAVSSGLGHFEPIGEAQDKKNYKKLMACAPSDAFILDLAAVHLHALKNARVV